MSTARCTSSRVKSLSILTALFCMAATRANAQTDTLRHAVFVHGAGGYNMNQWDYAITSLLGDFVFPWGHDVSNIENTMRIRQWRSYVQDDMVADSSILVGYSLGGVASRDATRYVNAAGLITVGSPLTGVPLVSSIPSAALLIDSIAGDISRVYSIGYGEFLEALNGGLGEGLYWGLVSALDNSMYNFISYMVEVGYYFLDAAFPAYYQTDLPPGSSYIDSLPTSIPNSRTLTVRMYPGHYGGPLALISDLTLEEADDEGENLVYWGSVVAAFAYDLQFQIDWEHEHAYAVHSAVEAGARLAAHLMNFASYWCGGVESGNVFGSCGFSSDGLIPTARQTFTGATNENLINGPAHTKELTNASVISYVGEKLCELSPTCG